VEKTGIVNSNFRILYFTGTGNTHWVVNSISAGLIARGASCEMLAADRLLADCGLGPDTKADPELLKATLADFLTGNAVLVLGFPTYEGTVPRPFRELLPLLPEGNGRKLACVATILLAGGDAVHLAEKALARRGYLPFLTTYVLMPGNICLPDFTFFKIHNGRELDRFYDSAGKAVAAIVEELLHEEAHFEGRTIADYLIGASNRWGEYLLPNLWGKHMFADAKCSRCGLCAAACPTGNISVAKGYPEFGHNCCTCLRCYNFCPDNAIQITEHTRDEKKYVRYKGFDGWKPLRLRHVVMGTRQSGDG
jgi:Pyruvate/2-oxoacid:ferredoxin oxidoreductase delta subunit